MKEGIPQHLQSLCESGFGIPALSHPGGVEERGMLLLRQFHWTNSSTEWEVLLPSLCPCYMHCSEGNGLCLQVPGQCVHSANWKPQKTKQTAIQVFKILAPQWQWVYQASAKWKITILRFYFVDWCCFPSGPHTELHWAPREGSLATAQPGMGSNWGSLRATQNRFGMTECTKKFNLALLLVFKNVPNI